MPLTQPTSATNVSRKTMTYTGGAGSGAVGSVTLFTVTGEVLIASIVAWCQTDLAGATATIALGVTNATTLFIAATTATDIDQNEFWVDNAPDAGGVALPAALKDIAITDNIINTIGTAAVSGGVIRYDVYWLPLSAGSSVVAA